MMDADEINALAELVGGEFQDRKVQDAVSEEDARGPWRLVRLVGVEAEAPELAKAEGLLVELRGFSRMVAGKCDVSNLEHVGLPFGQASQG